MLEPKLLIKASLDAGKEFFRPPESREESAAPDKSAPVLVPIRSLGVGHRERIANHLLSLDEHDRYLRFGYAAMAHLACSTDPEHKSCAEFGVSVVKSARGRGYGARLFDRAVMHARNEGVDMLFIHALSENTAMIKIARNAGAIVERDGSETEAWLRLPPATMDSRVNEMVEEQLAQTDYRLKVQAKQFWDILAAVQEIRRGVRDARDKAGR
jgi:GNAT superfamily N-acetyltransferase